MISHIKEGKNTPRKYNKSKNILMELQSLDKMLSIKFIQNMTFKVCIILYLIRQTIPAEKKGSNYFTENWQILEGCIFGMLQLFTNNSVNSHFFARICQFTTVT